MRKLRCLHSKNAKISIALPLKLKDYSCYILFKHDLKKHFIFFVIGGETHLVVLWAYSWVCAQGSLMEVLGGSHRVPRIEFRLPLCKANAYLLYILKFLYSKKDFQQLLVTISRGYNTIIFTLWGSVCYYEFMGSAEIDMKYWKRKK